MVYTTPLIKKDQTKAELLATALDKFTDPIACTDVSAAAKLFGVEVRQLTRPFCEVDLLIGVQSIDIFPRLLKEVYVYTSHNLSVHRLCCSRNYKLSQAIKKVLHLQPHLHHRLQRQSHLPLCSRLLESCLGGSGTS